MLRFFAGMCLCFTIASYGQQADASKADALFKAGKLTEALPLYEELAKENPNQALYDERLIICLSAGLKQVIDPAEATKLRTQMRDAGRRAVALGDASPIVQVASQIDPNESPPSVPMTPAGALFNEAERAFSAGDYSTALAKYTQAADADPKMYEAPLYAGDTAYKQHDMAAAGKWYARAIAINPDRETAYRYWGDAILAVTMMGDPTTEAFKARLKMLDPQASTKYLDAVVAEPYNRLAWAGIQKWAKVRNATLQAPRIDRPAAPTVDPANSSKITIHVDPSIGSGKSTDESAGWLAYSMVRASYRGDGFKKDFPNETQYRHTLKEESKALNMVVTIVKQKNIKPEEMDESTRNLIALSDAGMLDCWILISGADQGIAQDYDAYRKDHRQLLHDYLDKFVVHGGPEQIQ
jgi:tetratricopeptide (TPR) repeat protein